MRDLTNFGMCGILRVSLYILSALATPSMDIFLFLFVFELTDPHAQRTGHQVVGASIQLGR